MSVCRALVWFICTPVAMEWRYHSIIPLEALLRGIFHGREQMMRFISFKVAKVQSQTLKTRLVSAHPSLTTGMKVHVLKDESWHFCEEHLTQIKTFLQLSVNWSHLNSHPALLLLYKNKIKSRFGLQELVFETEWVTYVRIAARWRNNTVFWWICWYLRHLTVRSAFVPGEGLSFDLPKSKDTIHQCQRLWS